MKTSTKVFFATALGALVGTVISLEINNWFWWIGLIVGGLVGYLSHDFKKVIKAIPKAWEKTEDENKRIIFKRSFFHLLAISNAVTSITLGIVVLIILGNLNIETEIIYDDIKLIILCISLICLALIILSFVMALWKSYETDYIHIGENESKMNKKVSIIFFPLLSPFTAIFYTLKGLWLLTKGIYLNRIEIVKFLFITIWVTIAKFFKNLFILIHSDVRVICFIDACIGTALGFYFQSPIIGCLAGGVIGWFNYQIVSIKILKLSPKN